MGRQHPSFSKKQMLVAMMHESPHRVISVPGTMQSGKSFSVGWGFFRHVCRSRSGNEILLVASSVKQLRAVQIRSLYNFAHEFGMKVTGGGTQNSWKLPSWCGAEPNTFYGMIDRTDPGRLAGLTISDSWKDDISWSPDNEEFITTVDSRTGEFVDNSKSVVTLNPRGSEHWAKKQYVDEIPGLGESDEKVCIPFALEDNPMIKDVEAYKAHQKQILSATEYERLINGEWKDSPDAIYPNIGRVFGYPTSIPERTAMNMGIDVGKVNPTHVVLRVNGEKPTHPNWIIKEWRWSGRDQGQLEYPEQIDLIIKEFKEYWPRIRNIFVDPAAKDFRIILAKRLRAVGLGRINVIAADNSYERLGVVDYRFRIGKLRISNDCPHLKKELLNYRYDPLMKKNGREEPLKINDHGPDAMGYMEYELAGKPSNGRKIEIYAAGGQAA